MLKKIKNYSQECWEDLEEGAGAVEWRMSKETSRLSLVFECWGGGEMMDKGFLKILKEFSKGIIYVRYISLCIM